MYTQKGMGTQAENQSKDRACLWYYLALTDWQKAELLSLKSTLAPRHWSTEKRRV